MTAIKPRMIKQTHEAMLSAISSPIDDEKKVIEILIEFYYGNKRHRYSKLSLFLNRKLKTDRTCFDFILYNLDTIDELVSKNKTFIEEKINEIDDGTNSDFDFEYFLNNIRKLKDHIELEDLRIKALMDRDKDLSRALLSKYNDGINKAQNDILSSREELEVEIGKAKEELVSATKGLENKMNNSIVAILGIFAAIIIAFFGSLNILGNIFTSLGNEKVKVPELIIVACITGIIVFNLIFMLLYSVSKMIEREIGCKISREKLIELESGRNILKKSYHYFKKIMIRFPMLVGFNMFIILVTAGSLIIYAIK